MSALARAISQPDPVHSFGSTSPLDGLDRRSVGFMDVLAQSVSAVAPTAAATTIVLLVAGISPSVTVISIVSAAVLSFFVAQTVSQFARRFAASGSLYTYTARGLGARPGLVAGAALVVGYGAVATFALLGGAYYTTFLLGSVWPALGSPGGAAAVLVVEAGLLALVLVRGIRISSRIVLVVEGVSVSIVVTLLLVLLVQIGPIDPAAVLSVGGWSPAAIAAGSVIAITAFVGFESAATLGVEARTPLRTVPRAISWTVILSGGLYILAALTQVAGFSVLGNDLAASAAPINELAAASGLDGWAVVADVGIATSFLACAIGSTTALSRVVFTMGRDGVLPSIAGRTHPRHGTPIGAIWLALPPVALVPLGLIVAGFDIREAMHLTISVGATGYIVAYILVSVAAPVFLRRIGELTWGSGIVSIVSAVLLSGALVAFFIADVGAGGSAAWAAIAVAMSIATLVAASARLRRAPLARIGAYDVPVASQVLGGVGHVGVRGARPTPHG